ncbi:MAG: N-formylglutamate deformylase [Pseudomonadota bacterium]
MNIETSRGSGPIVLGLPHTGLDVPAEIDENLNELGRSLVDTDWHIHTLYEGLVPDVTTVRTRIHRYVIDVNRDPSGVSLYPGQNTTTLVPLIDFDGNDIWNVRPTEEDIEARKQAFHTIYHTALWAELERVKEKHGFAILYDCHSIRSRIPFLFEGTLPGFNIGTNNGATCSPLVEKAVLDICEKADSYTTVLNGRFKGGWTTRHYGQPDENIHAIQMELAQSTYLETEQPPFSFDKKKAERLRVHLRAILEGLTETAKLLGARP